MRAIAVFPGQPHSARIDDIAEPPLTDGPVLVRTLALGVCGTDRDIGRKLDVDIGTVNRKLVLDNGTVFGSVNANRSHYEAAAQSLARADKGWLARLITRRVALEDWQEALRRRPGDLLVVIEFAT